MPEKLKWNLYPVTLSSYLDYIFVSLRQKTLLRAELSPKFCRLQVRTRPEHNPKSPARLTTLPWEQAFWVHNEAIPLSQICGWHNCHFWIRGRIYFFSWRPEFNAFSIQVHIWKRREWSTPVFRLTSGFRKPTFTGQYFRWDSFGPTKRKTAAWTGKQ